MDTKTITIYDNEAQNISQLHSTLIPYRIYSLINSYFVKNGLTADIGCGIGRDTHWLNNSGYQTIGVDASEGMLNQAKILYPGDTFIQDELPALNQLSIKLFDNILCSAVLMHLGQNELMFACERLYNLLNDKGCLIVSYRGTEALDCRENGKLYEQISCEKFSEFFTNKGCSILLQESEIESKRQLTWHNFVIKK